MSLSKFSKFLPQSQISVAEKSEFSFYGPLVAFFHLINTCKGHDHGQECAFWCVKIGYKDIHDFKFKIRFYKKIRGSKKAGVIFFFNMERAMDSRALVTVEPRAQTLPPDFLQFFTASQVSSGISTNSECIL